MQGLADALNVNYNTALGWDHGTVPTPENQAKLAALYGIEPDVLFAEIAAIDAADAELLTRPA